MSEKVLFFSTDTKIDETKNYLDLVDRVCYYDEPNLNGVQLPSKDAKQFAETLVDMPVVAKCVLNEQNQPTFKGHEIYMDKDGDWACDTVPIGTHVSVEIKPDVVEINGVSKTLPCLFAKQRIWKRNKNVVAAVKRLFDEGKLCNSWELVSNKYSYDHGIKVVTDYEFLGNAFLGEDNPPAYPGAKVLSVSALQEARMLVAEAIAKDHTNEGGEKMEDQKEPVVSEQATEVVENKVENVVDNVENTEINAESEPAVEASQLTVGDLRRKLGQLIGGDGSIAFLFPNEQELWFHGWNALETEMLVYKYTVNGNEVQIGEPEKMELCVRPCEINQTIQGLNVQIENLNNTIASNAQELSELKEIKDKYDAIVAAQAQQQHANEVSALRAKAQKSGKFTEKELDNEEMRTIFENLDEPTLNKMIVDRVMASTIDVSWQQPNQTPTLKITPDDEKVDYISEMDKFLKK